MTPSYRRINGDCLARVSNKDHIVISQCILCSLHFACVYHLLSIFTISNILYTASDVAAERYTPNLRHANLSLYICMLDILGILCATVRVCTT